jgi:tight adherence protein B
MFLFIDGRQLLILNIALCVLVLVFGVIFLGIVFGLLAAVVSFFVPLLLVKWFHKKRIEKFDKQLVDSLNAMSNAFKAGLSFPQAVEQVSEESDPPLSQEFGLFIREIKLGVPLDDALETMAERVKCEDLDLVVTSTTISRQLGGNMAEMFDTISATIRERFRLEGKIKALTSQGKLQGWVVAAMPLVIALAINWIRPDLWKPMFDHWFGYVLIIVILFMELLGVLLIRKIVNINV